MDEKPFNLLGNGWKNQNKGPCESDVGPLILVWGLKSFVNTIIKEMLNKNIKEIMWKPNSGFGSNTWEITRTKLQTQ
jgi:hypothetical protein